MVAKHELKEGDRVPCAIYRTAKRMLVKVDSGSSGVSFELKCPKAAMMCLKTPRPDVIDDPVA